MIEILKATPDGRPQVVVCSICEPDPASVWVRPDDDPGAESLPAWVRLHYRATRKDRG